MTQKNMGNILVTGAATGVGLSVVKVLSTSGYNVLAAVLPGQDKNALLCAEPAKIIEADLQRPDDISRLIEEVKSLGELNGVISNAGIAVPGPVELIPMNQIYLQYQVNVFAPLQIIQGLLPELRKTQGRIIIIGAGQARLCLPNGGPYGSSKAAISAYADSLRAEVNSDGIHVSVIEPGAIKTGILKSSEEKWTSILTSKPKISTEVLERYRISMNKSFRMSEKAFQNAMEPDAFASAIAHILDTPKPKPRYLIGKEAKILGLISRLPDRLRVSILAKMS